MTSPTPQSERRRAARAVGTFPIRLSKESKDAPAILRDISEIGLACVAEKPLPEMTLVALDFSLPGASDLHHLRGAVVRCEPLPKAEQPKGGGKWDVAIYFTEVQPVTRAALKNYVGKTKRAR